MLTNKCGSKQFKDEPKARRDHIKAIFWHKKHHSNKTDIKQKFES